MNEPQHKAFLINAQPRGCKRLADNKPGPFRTWTDNFAQNEGLCGDMGTVLRWQLRLIKRFVCLSIALLRHAQPFLCLGSNGRWRFHLALPTFLRWFNLRAGCCICSFAWLFQSRSKRDFHSRLFWTRLKFPWVRQFCLAFSAFFSKNFSNGASCWEKRRWTHWQLSIHPSILDSGLVRALGEAEGGLAQLWDGREPVKMKWCKMKCQLAAGWPQTRPCFLVAFVAPSWLVVLMHGVKRALCFEKLIKGQVGA